MTTEQWEKARKGKFTASEIYKLFTEPLRKVDKEAGELSETAKSWIKQKVAESLTGYNYSFTNKYVEWGNEYEPVAAFEVKQRHPDFKYVSEQFFEYSETSGGSPDGWIESKNMVVEMKCPENPENHIEYCMMRNLKETRKDYYYQIQFNMLILSKHFNIDFMDMRGLFVSFHPLFDAPFPKYKEYVILPEAGFEELIVGKLIKANEYREEVLKSLTQ